MTPQSLTRSPPRLAVTETPCQPAELGDQLKTMFDRLTTGPMPRRLVDLADALEEAFQRGDLFEAPKKGRAS